LKKESNIMKYLLIVLAFLVGSQSLDAQAYNTAVGLRLGSGVGISIQQRIANKTSIEGILNSRLKKDQFTATVLVKQHFPILFKRFNLYTGMGLHKGCYTGTPAEGAIAYENPYGVSLMGGAEISLGRFNISYDYKPAFNISGGEKAFQSETSISLRYIFMKRPTKFSKWKKKRKKKKKAKAKKKAKSGGSKFGDIFKRN
jgi:hypothetical protein